MVDIVKRNVRTIHPIPSSDTFRLAASRIGDAHVPIYRALHKRFSFKCLMSSRAVTSLNTRLCRAKRSDISVFTLTQSLVYRSAREV